MGGLTVLSRRYPSLAAPMVVGAALLVAACGSDGIRMCRQSGTAEVCLVGGPSSYSLEAEGLQASSEATVSMAGGGSPMVVPIDAAGRVASEAGRVGVLGGPDPQKMIVTGTTSDGDPAEFEFTVPAIRR